MAESKVVEKALKVAKSMIEAPSRSMAKRLNVMHELTLAEALLELHEEVMVARERLGPAGYKIVQEVAQLRRNKNESQAD